MNALPVSQTELLSWHAQRAAQEADRRQVLADARNGAVVFGDINDLVAAALTRDACPQLAWRAIDDVPTGAHSVVIAMRKRGDADWMLLSGLWRHTPNGWREEMCNAPLPKPAGWDYRWMDELALIELLPAAAREATS